MYLAGVSVRRADDISEVLQGSRVSASTISELNQKAYVHIEEWRIGDKCCGMCNAVNKVFLEAKYQRCTIHFHLNVFSSTLRNKMYEVTRKLKAIHVQENKEAARKKVKDVVEQLRAMKLKEVAKKVEDGIEETLSYMDLPSQHWLKIRKMFHVIRT